MNLRKAERTDVTSEMDGPNSTLKRAVRFTQGAWMMLICFDGSIVTGSLSHKNGNWYGMNNLKNYGHGPGQAVLWDAGCDSGVMMAAQWFLDKHFECKRAREEQIREEEREVQEELEAARAADRKRRGIVLQGGNGLAAGPLFKLPAA